MNCQLRFIDEISEENIWINDKLQYAMRKYRYYKKKILVGIRRKNNQHVGYPLNNDEIKPGDIVRIRLKHEIKRTLDRSGKIGGCSFLKNQYEYCGKRYKVFKRINYFFDEKSQRILKSNSLFLLEACNCNGDTAYVKPCGRNCFIYWHKNWLEKVI